MSFPRYESYKDSGIEWLGEVPEHWDVCVLRRVLQEHKQGYYTNAPYVDVGVKLLRITDIRPYGKINSIDCPLVEVNDDLSNFLLKDSDFVFARTGGAGTFGLIENINEPIVFASYLIRFRFQNTVKSNFLRYFFLSDIFQKGIKQNIHGGVNQNIHAEDIKNQYMAFPKPDEQQKIAQFLDQETAKIDNLIAEQQQLIKLLKEKLISMVLSEANSTEYYEDRLENISEKVSRPVNLDEYEYYTPIGLFNRGRGLFHKEARAKDEMGDSDFFWIKENDLILSGQFAWEGSVALADIEDSECVVSHRYPVLSGRKNICLTEYLYAFFLTKHGDFFLNENSRGAAGRNKPLNINSLMKEKIPLPSMELQKKVRCLVHDIKPLQKEIGSQINLLKERRSTLISLVVAGKIDVRNYVPSQPNVEAMA